MNEKLKLKYLFYNRFVHWSYDIYNKYGRNLFQKSIPLNKNENFKPFFIVGSGRSGNTLLRRILTAKQGIVIPPETYVFGKIFRLHNVHKGLAWDDYVDMIISTFEYHPQFHAFELDSLSELALKLKQVQSEDRSLAHIINQFYLFYSRKKNINIQRWGDKTPVNALYAFRIKKLFPYAQFIHIIRDGVDVVNSYVKSGIYKDYYTAALRWKGSVKFLKKFGKKNSKQYYEIRYEDLVTKPEKSVQKACKYLKIAFDPSMVILSNKNKDLGDTKYLEHHSNIYNEINTDSIGKGRKQLSFIEKNNIKKTLNPLLQELNYKKI